MQSQRTQGSQRINGNQGDVTRGFTRGIGRNFLGSAGVGSQAMANVPSPVDADAAMAGAACMVLSVAHWHATKARVARALPYPPMASLTALLLLKLAGGLEVRAVAAQTLRGRLGRSLVWTPCRGFSRDGERSLPPRLAERARVSAPWRRASRRRAGFAQIHQILRDVTYWRVDGRVEAWKQVDRQLKW